MIPLQLELSNFLSYRQTAVVDFTGIHLACISGLNGAGKSTLLDAITWALFGQSRARSDDDVVNRLAAAQGEVAEVRLVFELERCIYRVIRRKKLGRSIELEFQMSTGGNGLAGADMNWKTLSESRSRETQASIQRVLNMTHDVFTNASFLLQGKADEFTTKTANRRKEILADLLGVNQWEQYRETAVSRRKEVETELLLLDGRISDIEVELAEQEARETALAEAQTELATVGDKLAQQEKLLAQMQRAEAATKQQRQNVKDLSQNVAAARRALASRQQAQAQRQAERDGYQALLDAAEQIAADYAAWQETDEQLQAWRAKFDAYNGLQQAQRPHELLVEREHTRLSQRRQNLTAQAERTAAMRTERTEQENTAAQSGGRLAEIEEELAALAAQEAAFHEARSQLQRLESERQLLDQEQRQLQGRRQYLQKQLQERESVAANLAEAEVMLQRLAHRAAAVAEQRQQLSNAQGERTALEVEQPRLKSQMDKLAAQMEGLQQETDDDVCPLCTQPLTAAHRQEVLSQLEAEGKQMGDAYRANKSRLAELADEIGRLEAELKRNGRVEHDQQLQQTRQAKAEARLAEIDRLAAEWETEAGARLAELETLLADDAAIQTQRQQVAALTAAVETRPRLEKERQAKQRQLSAAEARLAQIEREIEAWEREGEAALAAVIQQLEEQTYAPEAQAALAELAAEVAALGYDQAAHETAQAAHRALAEAPTRYQELKQAEAAVRPLDDTLADLKQQINEQENGLAQLVEQHEAATALLATLEEDEVDLAAAEKALFRLREEEVNANRSLGVAQQKLAVLDDRRQQQEQLQAGRVLITQRIQRLKMLEKACGRNGVQALLIEQALPEIEESANELLERLTGGKMHVHFETQRQLKSRDALAETLDIHIRDDGGERPYENYSGGEQFRVNFAIRLALSRVLAKRAGARLQTLVIDEGFGSQDPVGQQRLVEAIHTVQNDFKRILVITHIDELRELFPTRIEVEKTIDGSSVTVY